MNDVNRAYAKELGFVWDMLFFGIIFYFWLGYKETITAQNVWYFCAFVVAGIVGLITIGYFSRNRALRKYCIVFAAILFGISSKKALKILFPGSFFLTSTGEFIVFAVSIFLIWFVRKYEKVSDQEKVNFEKDREVVQPYIRGIVIIAIVIWICVVTYQKL